MRFTSTVQQNGKTATGIPVPEDVVEGLGSGKRPKVVVTIGGYSYRSSVSPWGGAFMLPLSAEHRDGAGVAAGDAVTVELTLDEAPRVVDVPSDLAKALKAAPAAKKAFEALSYSNQRRYVLAIEAAKKPETRARRIEKSVADLA